MPATRSWCKAGYHAQVLVAEGGSMLFLLDEATGERVALRRTASAMGMLSGRLGDGSIRLPS